jgi:arabinofuranosyltransferase
MAGPVMTREGRAVFAAGSTILALSLIRTAWLCDDAYISFRTADNILNGYGPVWNVAERVQAFTHPLWLAICTIAFAMTGSVYYTAMALGIVLTCASVWLMASRLALTPQHLIVCFAALLSSKAWIDYSTSGLENPLTHLLVICFVITMAAEGMQGTVRLRNLSFIAALLALNRLDLILIVAPVLGYECWRIGARTAVRALMIGLLPLIAWTIFATFYYGTPFPNTAYAKLTNEMTAGVRWDRGIDYLIRTLIADPVTLPVIVLSVFSLSRQRRTTGAMLFAGMSLYLLYVVNIGGDFMMGRFLSAPFVMSVALLARAGWLQSKTLARVTAAVMFVLGLLAPWEPALLSGYGYAYAHRQIFGPEPWGDADPPTVRVRRITDERLAYYEATGLLKVGTQGIPLHPWVTQGLELRAKQDPVVVLENVGFRGYYAGPRVHIVDLLALGDPLLARLPGGSRDAIMGHFRRPLPEGYVETIAEGRNRLRDPDLAAYYDRLHLVVAGPLWSRERLITTARLLSGAYDDELRRYLAKSQARTGFRITPHQVRSAVSGTRFVPSADRARPTTSDAAKPKVDGHKNPIVL